MSRVVTPEMEAYFVGIAMIHGTNPLARFGIERTKLSVEIAACMADNKGEPDLMKNLRRNYRELGGRLLDADPEWFYTQLADAYLDWLYGQNVGQGAIHPDEAARESSAVDHRLERNARAPFWKV